MQLDFSEFHPLDHNLCECRGYPGGWKRHLEYRWDFQWKDRVRRRTTCLVGHHHFAVWHRSLGPGQFLEGPVIAVKCISCDHDANPAQHKAALVDERERQRRRRA